MERLPFIDEHALSTGVPAGQLWASLIAVLPRTSAGGRGLARLLGCKPVAGTRTFTGTPGDALPGFRVVESVPGRRLLLDGQHRFSRYRLELVVNENQLRARTHAAFPGWTGRLYRGAVIGTGAHRVMTRYLMRRIVRGA